MDSARAPQGHGVMPSSGRGSTKGLTTGIEALQPTPMRSARQAGVRAAVILLGFHCVTTIEHRTYRRNRAPGGIFMKCTLTWTTPDGLLRAEPVVVETPTYPEHPSRLDHPSRNYQPAGQGIPDTAATTIIRSRADPWSAIASDGRRAAEHQPSRLLLHAWQRPALPKPKATLPAEVWRWNGPLNEFTGTITIVPEVWEYDTGHALDPLWPSGVIAAISDGHQSAAAASGALPDFQQLVIGQGIAIGPLAAIAPHVLRSAKDIAAPGDRPIGQHIHIHSERIRTYSPPVLAINLMQAALAARISMGQGPGVYRMNVADRGSGLGGAAYDSLVAFTYEAT